MAGRWSSPPAVRPAVRGRVLHHRAAGHDPGHPALPGLRADQGHRPDDGRADRRPLRRRHPRGDREGARAADRGARPGPQAHQDDRRRLGGAEGDQGGDGLPPGRRGVHLDRGADLQAVRRRVDLGRAQRAVPAGRRRVGHRLQDRRHDRPGGRHPARQPASGSRPGCSTPCPRPPTTATATCPSQPDRRRGRRSCRSTPDLVARCLDELAAEEGVVREERARPGGRRAGPRVYLVPVPPRRDAPSPARCCGCCARSTPTGCRRSPSVDWDEALAWLPGRTGAELAPEQAEAVRLALTGKVAVLTGGPGCGKSFTVRRSSRWPGPRRPRWCWPRRPAGPPSAWPS